MGVSVKRIRAVAAKEVIQIRRDPLSLAMAFLMPVMLLFIFGYAITLDVTNLATVVHDRDRTSDSRALVDAFAESGYFTVVDYVEGGEVERSLDSGAAQVAVTIPEGFAADLRAGRGADLQVVVDGSDSNTASIAIGYVEAVTGLYSQRTSQVRPEPAIDVRPRVWYNPELESRNFIIPGLIAVIMAVIAALLTSLTVAREWERGTMEQLISTPVKPVELVTGKLIPYFLIGVIDVVLSVVLTVYLFDVPLRGGVGLLMVLSSIFLFGGLSWGIFISIATKSQLVASQVALVSTFLPAFLLSGFMFAIINMPPPLRAMTHLIPARYFVTILKGIFLKGNTLEFIVFETVLLSAYAMIVFAVANLKFRKKIA